MPSYPHPWWYSRRFRPRRSMVPIKAVIVGLNYPAIPGATLRGAKSDAFKFRKGLMRYFQARRRDLNLIVDSKRNRVTPSDIITAIIKMFTKAKRGDILIYYFAGHGGRSLTTRYSNNSGYVEYQVTNDGNIRDAVMRQLAESVPDGCLFFTLTDCCRSGGMIEGLPEQIGTSTRVPVRITHRGVEPRLRYLTSSGLGQMSDIPNAVHFSACQNFQEVTETFFKDQNQHGGLFTDTLLKVLKKNAFQISNLDLVGKVRKYLRKSGFKDENAGLYCPDALAELNFLSFEWMGLSEKRKIKLEEMGQSVIGSLKKMAPSIRRKKKLKRMGQTVKGNALLPHKVIESLERGDGKKYAMWHWKRMVDDFIKKEKMRNCLAVCDATMDVSVALGLLVSELSDEPWKGKVINFSAEPDLHVIEGDDLESKTKFVKDMERGVCIDFQRVFDCILDVAVDENLEEDQMIKRIFVLSNMGFDEASANSWETDYQEITRKYTDAGYGSAVPQIVFWNLEDSRIGPMPTTQNGVVLVSGFSENLLALFLVNEGVITL